MGCPTLAEDAALIDALASCQLTADRLRACRRMKARQIKETPKSQRAARTSAEEPANPRPCSCPVHLWAGKAAQAQRCHRRIEKAIMPPQPAADSPVAASLLMKAHPSHCTSSGHSLARRAHQLPPAWVSPPRKSAVRQPFWREFRFASHFDGRLQQGSPQYLWWDLGRLADTRVWQGT